MGQNNIPKIGPGSSNLIFGKSPGGGNRMIGSLDDVRFYDRELGGAEVPRFMVLGMVTLLPCELEQWLVLRKQERLL